MLGEEAGLLADTLIGLNTIDFRCRSRYFLLLLCSHLTLGNSVQDDAYNNIVKSLNIPYILGMTALKVLIFSL